MGTRSSTNGTPHSMRSNVSGDPPLTVLPAASQRLLDAARHVLATSGLPPVVLIGGLAVTMRVGAAGIAHRATLDIDLVTVYVDREPQALEILAAAHHSEQHPLLVDNVKVDLIPTSPIVDGDLDGFSDKDILFLAGHRWAFEGAEPARLSTAGSPPLDIDVATPAGLVAAKSHAAGYPRSGRRATKHGSDLLDLFRLVDLYNIEGSLTQELRSGPTELARIIADVAQREILINPAAAVNKMASASPTPIDTNRVTDALEVFIEELRA